MRLWALATLVLWLSALTTSMACGPVESGAATKVAHSVCGSDACGKRCHSDADSPLPLCPPNDSSCVTLKTALFTGKAQPLPQPELQLLYLLPFIVTSLDTGFDVAEPAVFRHVPLRDWTLRPEVSLGPASRSHAPPALV